MLKYITAVFLLLSAFIIRLPSSEAATGKAVALTLKVKGEVLWRRAGVDSAKGLIFGTPLDDGDWVKTGKDGFCALIFTDDKSQIKLRENTEITIEGKRDNQSNIAKRISLEVGQLYAKVDQQRGSLQIATPTSVASVKGTEFWVVVFEDGTTVVVTIEGVVELINRFSGKIVEIRPGQQGSSNSNGDVESGPADPNKTPKDPDQPSDSTKTIKIQIEDPNGRPRTITIQYVE
ncbi:MAG: FecR domain-containing protein [Calditrichota bacterium]